MKHLFSTIVFFSTISLAVGPVLAEDSLPTSTPEGDSVTVPMGNAVTVDEAYEQLKQMGSIAWANRIVVVGFTLSGIGTVGLSFLDRYGHRDVIYLEEIRQSLEQQLEVISKTISLEGESGYQPMTKEGLEKLKSQPGKTVRFRVNKTWPVSPRGAVQVPHGGVFEIQALVKVNNAGGRGVEIVTLKPSIVSFRGSPGKMVLKLNPNAKGVGRVVSELEKSLNTVSRLSASQGSANARLTQDLFKANRVAWLGFALIATAVLIEVYNIIFHADRSLLLAAQHEQDISKINSLLAKVDEAEDETDPEAKGKKVAICKAMIKKLNFGDRPIFEKIFFYNAAVQAMAAKIEKGR